MLKKVGKKVRKQNLQTHRTNEYNTSRSEGEEGSTVRYLKRFIGEFKRCGALGISQPVMVTERVALPISKHSSRVERGPQPPPYVIK